MRVKKYKGKVFGAEFTADEKKAIDIEIRKQVAQSSEEYANNLDALVLYTLHSVFGFGKNRLRQFYDAFKREHKSLVEYYEMPDDDIWLADRKLKEIGVDICAWNSEES